MNLPRHNHYGFHWRRRDLAVLIGLCAASAGALLGRWAPGRLWVGPAVGVDQARVRAATETIDPNTASVASMQRLPGLGPAKTAAIVAYRDAHRPRAFAAADDLTRVDGIGPVTLRRIRQHLALPAPRR